MEASPKLRGSNAVSALATGAASKMLAVQPDRVLCTLALRGNAAAFEVLYTRYHRSIYAFIYHLLGRGANAEDAEDLAQDTFGSAFDKLDARRDGGSFKAWLYTIARNRTFDHIKSDKTGPSNELDDALEADIGASAELTAEQRADMMWLVSALQALPERQRQALVMREMGGMSYDEIAGSIDATVPSVKQLINRARTAISDAATVSGFSPRHLDKSLQAVAPIIPIVASGAALTAFGIGGGSAAGVSASVGGFSAAAKVATVAVTVAVVGGSAAGVDDIVRHDGAYGKPSAAQSNAQRRSAPDTPKRHAEKIVLGDVYSPAGDGSSGTTRRDAVYFNRPFKRDRGYSDTELGAEVEADPLTYNVDVDVDANGGGGNLTPGAGEQNIGSTQPPPSGNQPSTQADDDSSVLLPDHGAAIPQGQSEPSEPCEDGDEVDEVPAPPAPTTPSKVPEPAPAAPTVQGEEPAPEAPKAPEPPIGPDAIQP